MRRGRKPKVVMVDDEPDFVRVVRSWAEPRYSFVGLSRGAELLPRMEKERPGLVVLDVYMPDVDGFELCRRIRDDPRYRDVPVLFLTGSADGDDFLRNMEAGGNGYLTKPVDRAKLLAEFRRLAGGVDEAADDEA
ncbi:MAG: response regulator [Elusimicrobia bacterium]|nr:response regulator [Elusimicrobiota bacterium]